MQEINPKQTPRAQAFELWMNAPMPMVTIFKTLNIARLVKISRKYGYKLNMLMCWCIGKAASNCKEFYLLPVGKKLMKYDKLAINIVAATKSGNINTCDIPFSENIKQFNNDYLKLTKQVYDSGKAYNLGDEYMVIGTSTLVECEIDGAVNIYAGIYNNPFMIWGKYKKHLFKRLLKISFQFHHTQMDGVEAGRFLECLQNEINSLNIK